MMATDPPARQAGGPRDEPEVSIGMPVYNGGRWVEQALESLLAQSFTGFELIVSDNASTDGTESICRAVAAGDPRVRYSRNGRNVGPVANFNRALELARGDFFMWAACDDLWHPAYIETLLEQLRANPGAAVAFCDFDNIDEQGRPVREYPHLFELPADDPAERLSNYLAQPEHLGKANLIYGLMPRELLRAAGGFGVWSERDWGIDMLVVFRVLSMGCLVLSRDRMFHKRLTGQALADLPRGWVGSRLAHRRRDLLGWKSYFKGYERLIDIAEGLPETRRARMRSLARARYRVVRDASLREMRGGAVGRMKGILRQIRSANVLSVRRK